jgi:uncharacterized membrane protein YphA (DoxX/SURF4 family)
MTVGIVVLRCCLAAIFASAATAKLRDREGIRRTLHDFGVPRRLTALAAIAVPKCACPSGTTRTGAGVCA